MNQTDIGYLQSKIDGLIMKVKNYREKTKQMEIIRKKEVNINRLNFKVYNIKNYIEQLMLVKDLKLRV